MIEISCQVKENVYMWAMGAMEKEVRAEQGAQEKPTLRIVYVVKSQRKEGFSKLDSNMYCLSNFNFNPSMLSV